jgi:hypothetical protein
MEGEGVWSYGDYTAELHRLAQQCEHVLMDITEGRVATDLDLEGAFKSVDQGLDWMLHTLQECHLYLQRHQFSDAHYDVYDYYHREYKQLDYSYYWLHRQWSDAVLARKTAPSVVGLRCSSLTSSDAPQPGAHDEDVQAKLQQRVSLLQADSRQLQVTQMEEVYQERSDSLHKHQDEDRRASQARADESWDQLQRLWLQLRADVMQLFTDESIRGTDQHGSMFQLEEAVQHLEESQPQANFGLAAHCSPRSNSRPPPGFGLQPRPPVSPPPGFAGVPDSSALVLDGDLFIPPPPGFDDVSCPVSLTLRDESPLIFTSVKDLSTEDKVCSFAVEEGEEEWNSDLLRWMMALDVDCTLRVTDSAAQTALGRPAAQQLPMHPPAAKAPTEDAAPVTAVPLVTAYG